MSQEHGDVMSPLISHFNELLEKYGDSAQAVAWRDEAFQRFRFASVCQVFDGEREPFSVYEVGCGLGHMRAYLAERYPQATYAGCDINEQMIRAALDRDPTLRVEHRDITADPPPASDYVVASGIFNLRCGVDEERWSAVVRDVLRSMYAVARKGMASNFLTSRVDWKRDVAYHQDPAAILDFAQRELSRFVEIRHAYYPWEFTLLVYREAQPLSNGVTPTGDPA